MEPQIGQSFFFCCFKSTFFKVFFFTFNQQLTYNPAFYQISLMDFYRYDAFNLIVNVCYRPNYPQACLGVIATILSVFQTPAIVISPISVFEEVGVHLEIKHIFHIVTPLVFIWVARLIVNKQIINLKK